MKFRFIRKDYDGNIREEFEKEFETLHEANMYCFKLPERNDDNWWLEEVKE